MPSLGVCRRACPEGTDEIPPCQCPETWCRGEKSIRSFRGQYAFLSNFFIAPFCDGRGWEWESVEHAFQAAKTVDEEQQRWVQAAETPGQAKRRGRAVDMRPEWDTLRVPVMRALLRIKFSATPLREQLLGTGLAELVEGNRWGDAFWGVDERRGGENVLGRLLMEVRAELRRG